MNVDCPLKYNIIHIVLEKTYTQNEVVAKTCDLITRIPQESGTEQICISLQRCHSDLRTSGQPVFLSGVEKVINEPKVTAGAYNKTHKYKLHCITVPLPQDFGCPHLDWEDALVSRRRAWFCPCISSQDFQSRSGAELQ